MRPRLLQGVWVLWLLPCRLLLLLQQAPLLLQLWYGLQHLLLLLLEGLHWLVWTHAFVPLDRWLPLP